VASNEWVEKLLQLYQVQIIRHGVMMVGPSGSGKTASWKVLLEALDRLEGVKGEAHVLDPKAITKEELFGSLESTTREWTDGLFTGVLRRIVDNVTASPLSVFTHFLSRFAVSLASAIGSSSTAMSTLNGWRT
jgi:dynein heavy chain 1